MALMGFDPIRALLFKGNSMSLLWIDGFENYGSIDSKVSPSDILLGKYFAIHEDDIYVRSSPSGGKCIQINHSSSRLGTSHLTTDNTLIVGFAFMLSTFYDEEILVDFRYPNSTGDVVDYESLVVKIVEVDGIYELQVTHFGAERGTSNGANITIGDWYYLEVKVTGGADGGVIVRLNEEEIINYDGDITGSYEYYDSVIFSYYGQSCIRIDDLYICDSTGSTNNDFLGTCNVKTMSLSSDVTTEWSESSGNASYELLNEEIFDSDNYIYSSTSGDKSTFETNNVYIFGGIVGLMTTTRSSISGYLDKYAKLNTQNGTNNLIHTSNMIPGMNNYIASTSILETDPDGNEWTRDSLNNVRLGVELS